ELALQLRDLREDLPDEVLAAPVVRMRLAAVDDLDRPGAAVQREQALQVVEQQVGPLVGRRTTGEADREGVREQARAGALVDPGDQVLLRRLVRRPQLVPRNAQRVAQAR